MNGIIKSARVSQNLWSKNNALLLTAIRRKAHWNEEFLPGPYPTTKRERALAAEKYGLSVEEYEPVKDNGLGAGDYPDFRLQSADSKDPFYPWDNPEHKRNYGELVHERADLVREDRYDCDAKLPKPMWKLWCEFLGCMAGIYGVYWISNHVKMSIPWTSKQIPGPGKVHYTFEVEE